ncbi:unnamed protein product, partial [Ixodes hexagonus]
CGIRGPSFRAASLDDGNSTQTRPGGSSKRQGVLRIVGGVEARPIEFPWQISLRRRAPFTNEDQGHSCGGSIISEQYIVTAAHCVEGPYAYPSSFVVVVGDQSIFQRDATEDGFAVESRCSEGGSSLPPRLQKADLPIVDHNVCRHYYSHVMEVYDDTMVCAGPMYGGRGVCQGDSGGPLQCRRSDGRYVLAGATSWGVKCAGQNQPGVFAKISTQVDWIKYVAGITT